MIYRPDSGKRLSHQNLAKFALCRKILRRQDNYPPRRFKRHVEPESDDCERWFTGGFPMKNWCSFDAMTVRKRTDLRLLSDLLSPISEPWNDVFQTQEKPVNALFSGIYGLLVDGRDRTTRTLDTRFWRQCWNFSRTPTSPRFWGFVAIRAADASGIDAFLMIC